MKLVPFAPEHFLAIEWQADQLGGKDFFCDEWSEDIAENSTAWTGIDEASGDIVACAGVYPTRILRYEDGSEQPAHSLAWAVFSPLLPKHAKSVYAAIASFLNGRGESRIEAYVDPGHAKAAPFLKRLGFHEIGASFEHPDGRDLLLFARVRH